MNQKNSLTRFKPAFLTGLAALFPILITGFLLVWLYSLLEASLGRKVTDILKVATGGWVEILPAEVLRIVSTLIGIILVVLAIYVLGVLILYMGRRLVTEMDQFFERFPIVKAIYPHARQVSEIVFGSDRSKGFRRVVALQYPRRGVYTIGFLTGDGLKELQDRVGRDLVAVLVPTSPTPFTGFVVMVPRDEVIELNISMEAAFRFCMTAGMVGTDQPLGAVGGPLTAGADVVGGGADVVGGGADAVGGGADVAASAAGQSEG